MNAEDPLDTPDVELRMPADPSYAHMVRTTTAALTARLDFTLDDIEDAKIAVTEAMALLVAGTPPGRDLTLGYRLSPGHLLLTLTLPSDEPVPVDRASFAWQVLSTLVEDVQVERLPHRVRLTLSLRSSAAG